jgi:hypothetical protein
MNDFLVLDTDVASYLFKRRSGKVLETISA